MSIDYDRYWDSEMRVQAEKTIACLEAVWCEVHHGDLAGVPCPCCAAVEVDRLKGRVKALARYVQHEYGCGPSTFADVEEERKARRGPQCTCGLVAALAAVEEER